MKVTKETLKKIIQEELQQEYEGWPEPELSPEEERVKSLLEDLARALEHVPDVYNLTDQIRMVLRNLKEKGAKIEKMMFGL